MRIKSLLCLALAVTACETKDSGRGMPAGDTLAPDKKERGTAPANAAIGNDQHREQAATLPIGSTGRMLDDNGGKPSDR